MNSVDYASVFIPDSIEILNIKGKECAVPKSHFFFRKWVGEPINNTFGGKSLLDVNGYASFAELAIVSLFQKAGWEARWVCTYGHGKQNPLFMKRWKDDCLKNQENCPIEDVWVQNLLNRVVVANNNSFSGCWDVIAWRDDTIVFVESKRYKRDSIRQTQVQWLESGLNSGLSENNFLIVQWDLK